MKFLALAGAFGNDEKFKVQMAPLLNDLESDGSATIHFIHGLHEAKPPPGFEEFFGGPPFYRWMEESKDPELVDGLEKIRDFPVGASPEDTIRLFNPLGATAGAALAVTANQALEHLKEVIRDHGPFEGIIGYSEGALIGTTLVMKEQEYREQGEYNNTFKLGMFFGGWPPLQPDLTKMILCDETDVQMPISTIHVIGSLDPYLDGSMALYNVCDPDTAILFDHAKGHALPRDKETVKELGDLIRDQIKDVREREQQP